MKNHTQEPHPGKQKTFTEVEERMYREVIKERNYIVKKFPLPFAILGSFGLVATFYGFEHLIDQNAFLTEHPLVLLVIGILCLGLTGSLYRKLG